MTYNESLLGLDRPLAQLEQLIHPAIQGSDLHLTIDRRIQQAADQALGGRPGTIVVLDGHSGAVLAMVSKPDFDPNQVQDPGYLSDLVSSNDNPDCQGIFINRATQGLYAPGSTFKTVTLIARWIPAWWIRIRSSILANRWWGQTAGITFTKSMAGSS